MTSRKEEMLKRLLATFRVEADEHLKALTAGLLTLEQQPSGDAATEVVETIFREAHSLKGAARAVNHSAIEALCQSLESVFAALKSGSLAVSTPLLDQLHQALSGLAGLLQGDAGAADDVPPDIARLINRVDRLAAGEVITPTTAPGAADDETPADPEPYQAPVLASRSPDAVRVTTAKLDTVMGQVEALLSPRLAARQRLLELHETTALVKQWKKSRAGIQPALRRLERTLRPSAALPASGDGWSEVQALLAYLEREQHFLESLDEGLMRLNKEAARDHRNLSGITDGLLQDVMEMQLLPVATLLDSLSLSVRELARAQGKEVVFNTRGGEIEADRRVLEEIKDPLIHLMRNAVDHGIEPSEVRHARGKPPRGSVTITVSQLEGGKLELLVTDDGGGIDADAVRSAAEKLSATSHLGENPDDPQEALGLVFQSGVTTSPIITDVSGRGLGLAIVREKVERLGGSVSIQSEIGVGTTFRIVLPLSMALFRGVLVRVGGRTCVLPSTGVERVARVSRENISTVENRETIVLDGPALALVSLADLLELPRSGTTGRGSHLFVAVLCLGEARIAFEVDELLGEQEILLKGLGPQLKRVRNVTGASQLGTGEVVPVLNVADLMESAIRDAAATRLPVAEKPSAGDAPQSILVAEDSITSRSLIKNILESAGYAVTTAVDGVAAFTALKRAAFDLVVSDVEMPRMDGFELTARIRADRQLADLPVVLVTALEAHEHRERGIDVGANAYIVKSSFDQSNLLETIRRLI